MFDVVGLWLTKHLMGEITLPDHEAMDKDWRPWVLADCHQQNNFQTDFVMDIVKECGKEYPCLTTWMSGTFSTLGSITRTRTC